MKKIFSLLILLISLLSFGQRKEYKQAVNLFNDKKYEESLVIVDKLLNKEFGNLTEEQEFYSLQMRINCYNSLKNYKKAYDVALPYLAFIKNSKSLFFEETKIKAIDEAEKTLEFYKSKLSSEQSISSNISTNSSTIQNTEAKSTSDNKTVTLMVSGTGKTLEEAKLNALRSAIEQAFGAFISSKTEILNDSNIKDEVVSVSNGNIQKYDVISQVEIPDNGYAITLKATVSIEKLTSFAQSKGVTVEFKGGLFSTKIMLQKLNEDSEFIAVKNLVIQTFKGLENSIDYSLIVHDPILSESDSSKETYDIKIEVIQKPNLNYNNIWNYFKTSLDKICLSESQASEIEKTGKKICKLYVDDKIYLLRNDKSINTIFNFSMLSLMLAPNTFIIKSNLGTEKIDSDRGKFFRAFVSYYRNDTKDMNVSLVTAPEQVDIFKLSDKGKEQASYGAQELSLLNYVKIHGLDLDNLFNDYLFVANEYDSVLKQDNNIKIITKFDYARGISDFYGKGNLTYLLNYSLNDLKNIQSFEIEKESFEKILINYPNYRKNIERETWSCFLSGTKISTPNGGKSIEDIKVGDEVICFDDKGNLHTSIVESINEHVNQDVYKYSVWNGEPLFATPNHWVLTSENTFSEIGKLNEMLTLVDIDGGLRPITKVEYYGKGKVYNFIVKDYHTYIANGIKVHNGGKGKYKSKRLVNVKQIKKK